MLVTKRSLSAALLALVAGSAACAHASATKAAPAACRSDGVPRWTPSAGASPVSGLAVRLEPDFATGELRERGALLLSSREPLDSLELALNDWFTDVRFTAAGGGVTAERGERSVVVRMRPARTSETICFELRGRPVRSEGENRSVIGRESLFLLWSDVFYPVDYNAWAPVTVSVKVPAGWRVLGPGHEVATSPDGLHVFHSDHPVRLFSVFADAGWVETRRTVGGYRIRTLLHPGSQRHADTLIARTADVLAKYAELYGPYAFDDFTFATVDSTYARRSLPGGVIYSPAYLDREMARTGFDGHETALLWWFSTTAGRGPGSFQWTEGLGDYAEYLYDEARGKPLPENWRRFRAAYLATSPDSEPPITGLRGRTPQAIVHGKYPWLMHLLRFAVGDAPFLRSQRLLFDRFRYRTFTLDEMVATFEEATRQSLEWWKTDWLMRTGVPEVRFTWTANSSAPARWQVTTYLDQATPPRRFPAEIGIYVGAASPQIQRVQVDSAARTFTFPTAARPDSVVLDPRGWLLLRRR